MEAGTRGMRTAGPREGLRELEFSGVINAAARSDVINAVEFSDVIKAVERPDVINTVESVSGSNRYVKLLSLTTSLRLRPRPRAVWTRLRPGWMA